MNSIPVSVELFQNFLFNASLKGSATQEETSAKENCNVPWAILLDPTSACNMHCTGCWAAEYGNQLNLSLETIDSIICQGKNWELICTFILEENLWYVRQI